MAAADIVTADQFEQMGDLGRWFELERGAVVAVNPPGLPHGTIAVNIAAALRAFVRPRQLGIVAVESGYTIARNPDTVRGPDVSFVRRERLITDRREGWLAGAPDLAVEIRSPGDSMRSLRSLANEYLAAGAALVWLVDPKAQTVIACSPGGAERTLGPVETLDGGELLSGFSLEVAAIFET
jgi:Uma2 family endonuclease